MSDGCQEDRLSDMLAFDDDDDYKDRVYEDYKRAWSMCDPKTVLLHVTRTNYEIMWDDKSESKGAALFANELLGLYAAQTGPCPRDKDIKDKWYSSWFKKSCVEKIQQLKDSGWNVMFSRDTAPAGGCKLELASSSFLVWRKTDGAIYMDGR